MGECPRVSQIRSEEMAVTRIVQGVSFSPDDPLIPKVKALVRARQFSRVCRQALAAWFEKEDRDEVLGSLKRIEQRLAEWKRTGHPPLLRETMPRLSSDAEGTSAAADALDSY